VSVPKLFTEILKHASRSRTWARNSSLSDVVWGAWGEEVLFERQRFKLTPGIEIRLYLGEAKSMWAFK
jgi:hypothetical protein